MSVHRLGSTLAALAASLTACGGGSARLAGPPAPARAPTASCPVTIPNGHRPPGEQPSPEDHGSGGLWTAIPVDGRILAARQFVLSDGSMRIKFPWWGSRRAGANLSVTGTSLDPSARPARAHISPGHTGAPRFWASGVIFPTEGCWRVTARAGRAKLTLTVFLQKAVA